MRGLKCVSTSGPRPLGSGPLWFPAPLGSPHRFCGSCLLELLCVRLASFYSEPEPSAGTWLPLPNPSAERSGPHDPERGSLLGGAQHQSDNTKQRVVSDVPLRKKIPGIFLVNSTRTWTWLVAISVSSRKFSSVLYWSWSWKASFILRCNKLSLPKHLESVPHQLLCHILRNLMFVVSICDDFHEHLLLFTEFNLFLRRTKPPRWHILAVNTVQTTTLRRQKLSLPLTVSWSKRRVCCPHCLQLLFRLRSTVLGRLWCSFVAFLIYTGSPSAGLQAVMKTPLSLFHTCAGVTHIVFYQQPWFYPPHTWNILRNPENSLPAALTLNHVHLSILKAN